MLQSQNKSGSGPIPLKYTRLIYTDKKVSINKKYLPITLILTKSHDKPDKRTQSNGKQKGYSRKTAGGGVASTPPPLCRRGFKRVEWRR